MQIDVMTDALDPGARREGRVHQHHGGPQLGQAVPDRLRVVSGHRAAWEEPGEEARADGGDFVEVQRAGDSGAKRELRHHCQHPGAGRGFEHDVAGTDHRGLQRGVGERQRRRELLIPELLLRAPGSARAPGTRGSPACAAWRRCRRDLRRPRAAWCGRSAGGTAPARSRPPRRNPSRPRRRPRRKRRRRPSSPPSGCGHLAPGRLRGRASGCGPRPAKRRGLRGTWIAGRSGLRWGTRGRRRAGAAGAAGAGWGVEHERAPMTGMQEGPQRHGAGHWPPRRSERPASPPPFVLLTAERAAAGQAARLVQRPNSRSGTVDASKARLSLLKKTRRKGKQGVAVEPGVHTPKSGRNDHQDRLTPGRTGT